MKIVFSNNIVKNRDALNAGSKAKNDVEDILRNIGFYVKNFDACNYWNYTGFRFWLEKIRWCLGDNWLWFWVKVPIKSILFYQWPFEGEGRYARMACILKRIKGYKTICLIHDIISLRSTGMFSDEEVQDMKSYEFDYIIVHNEKMKQLMIEKGFDIDKLFVLELFDYCNNQCKKIPVRPLSNEVVIAGNLVKEKSAYIYYLPENIITYHLYGQGYKYQGQKNINYHGAFTPEDILECMVGSFGLVWDGDCVDECIGRGLYLKYNNPHKVSLYITAGLPIIIWEEAALAKYISDNKLGFTVASISEISEKISRITEQEYNIMKENIEIMSIKLSKGENLRKQMNLIISDIKR